MKKKILLMMALGLFVISGFYTLGINSNQMLNSSADSTVTNTQRAPFLSLNPISVVKAEEAEVYYCATYLGYRDDDCYAFVGEKLSCHSWDTATHWGKCDGQFYREHRYGDVVESATPCPSINPSGYHACEIKQFDGNKPSGKITW